jgi:hypothetical protein
MMDSNNTDISILLNKASEGYKQYLRGISSDNGRCRLTRNSRSTPYARCFAIFGFHLLCEKQFLESNKDVLVKGIIEDLKNLKRERRSVGKSLCEDKPYLQLLTFSLSALSILGVSEEGLLNDHIMTDDFLTSFNRLGVFSGNTRSGNHAMFTAIMLCHAHNYMGQDCTAQLDSWVTLHLNYMNKHGFWGSCNSMSHLQFQNGYHQYEIFEYLGTKDVPWEKAASNVASLADSRGHFAPWPGGGACYDYDAVFILTGSQDNSKKYHLLFKRSIETIFSEQNEDGGFCESRRVQPNKIKFIREMLGHILAARGRARYERFRAFLSIMRPRNKRIHTHWSSYSRRWNESNCWDSWFRMLTIARIDVALNPDRISEWGFIDYPGIGYHHLLRNRQAG